METERGVRVEEGDNDREMDRQAPVLQLTFSLPQPTVGHVCLFYLQCHESLQQSQTLGNSRLP